MIHKLILILLGLVAFTQIYCIEISITDFGAISDSVTINTKAIQSAIDKSRAIELSDIKFNLLNPDSRPALWVEKAALVDTRNLSVNGPSTHSTLYYFRDKSSKKVKK